MAAEFRLTRRVEFADTDMAGIAHFAAFFRYMEATEHAFFRSLGLSVHMEVEGRRIGWPRVSASCDFRQPLRFEDEVEVHLRVREKKEKSLSYEFIFRRIDGSAAVEVARGRVTAVCAAMDAPSGRMRATRIPEAVSSRIEAVVEEV